MTGTGAALQSMGGGLILPTPIVRIVSNAVPGVTTAALQTPPNDGGTKTVDADMNTIIWTSTVAVTAQVDDVLLDPAVGLEIQLFRYRGRVNGRKGSGWSAPADHDPFLGAASTVGSHMLSGLTTGVQCERRTRAKVLTQGQRSAFNLGGFFRRGKLGYIDAALSGPGSPASSQVSNALLSVPINKSLSVSGSATRNVQPWSRRNLNGYFAFSFSVADSSGRGNGRIFGPMSPTIVAGSSTHPFNPNQAASAAFGFPVCDINPDYNNVRARIWWAERQSEQV